MNSRFLGLAAIMFASVGWVGAQTPLNAPPPPVLGNTVPAGQPVLSGDAVAPAGGGGIIPYGSADYLLWQIRRGNLPATVSTIPVGLLSVRLQDRVEDELGNLITTIDSVGYAPVSITNEATFGGGSYSNIGAQNGGRFSLGFWLDEDMSYGLEAGFFFLERGSDRFVGLSTSPGNQFLLQTGFQERLYVQDAAGDRTVQATYDVFVPRQASSSLVGTTSVTLYGGDLNARSVLARVGGFDFGGLVGFRYLNFKDELTVLNSVNFVRPPRSALAEVDSDSSISISENLTFNTVDRVRVWNYFYGAQVGADLNAQFGAYFIYTRFKAAFGNMHQVAQVSSGTEVVNRDPLRPSPASYGTSGGLLAAPGDNGRHSRDRFAVVPEVNVKFGYQFTDWLRGYVGYDGLYMQHVARAGNSSVTNTLNSTIRVGGTEDINVSIAQPTFRFRDADVWAQGVSFGFECRY